MLISILFSLLTTLICYSWGRMICNFSSLSTNPTSRFFVLYLIGFCMLTFFANTITLFTGIGNWIYFLVLAIPLLIELRQIQEFSSDVRSIWPKLFMTRFGLILSILLFGIMHAWVISHPDTIAYQNDLIKFAIQSKHPANIVTQKNQLGYGGSWYPMAGLFSYYFLLHKIMTFANLSMIGVSMAFLFGRIEKNFYRNPLASCIYLLLLILTFWEYTFFRLADTSAAPDTIAAILVLASFYLYLIESRINWTVYVLCCTAVTIKLSATPILLLIAFDFFQKRKWSETIKLAIVCTLIITPLLIKNVIATGYLIYPSAPTKVFQNPQTPSISAVEAEAHYIKAYARLPKQYQSQQEVDQIANSPFPKWIPSWWENLEPASKSYMIVFIIGLAFMCYNCLRRPSTNPRMLPYLMVTSLGFVFWLTLGPAVRFGSMFLLSPLLFAAVVIEKKSTTEQFLSFPYLNPPRMILTVFNVLIGIYLIYRLLHFADLSSMVLPKGPAL